MTDSLSSSDLPSSASFFVDALPGQPPSTINSILQYAGHLPSHPPSTLTPAPDSHLWFWLIKAKHIAQREKFVIWFNGGPGCSSAEGGLMEIGPLTTQQNPDPSRPIELEEKVIGWSEYANILFIDQPAGTGFSYVNVGDDAAEQLVVFLKNFYKVFPEFSKIDTYLAGESFAGQYIPYFAQAIFESAALSTPLLGLMMGNPWFNPKVQYSAYLDFAYQKGLLVKGTSTAKAVEKKYQDCKDALEDSTKSNKVLVTPCEAAVQAILDASAKIVNGTKMTPVAYNITQSTAGSLLDWPVSIKDMKTYLHQKPTIQAFHATRKLGSWTLCNETVGDEMEVRNSAPSSTLLPALLEKLKVMIYVGDQDFICNSLGINRSISEMEWNGQLGWGLDGEGQPIMPQDYYVNDTKQGSWTESRGLSFVLFDRASHLVPVDLPYASHDMLLRFIGVDPLMAAGPVRSIPSQVGADDFTGIILKTHPNGTLIGQEEAELENVPTLGAAPVLEAVEERQAYYGPRQTVTLLVVLTGLILGLMMLFKWRRRRKRMRQGLRGKRSVIRMTTKSPTSPDDRAIFLDHQPSLSRRERFHHQKTDSKKLGVNEEAQTLLHTEEGRSNEDVPRSSFQSGSAHHVHDPSQLFSLEDDDEAIVDSK